MDSIQDYFNPLLFFFGTVITSIRIIGVLFEVEWLKETEEVGFEPTSPLLVNLFSRQTHSATLPLFH